MLDDFENYEDVPVVRARMLWRRDVERFGKDLIPNVASYLISKMTGVPADQIERMAAMPWKPIYGQPCNGCGVCCQASRCPTAARLLQDDDGPCPFLRDAGDKYRCSLMEGEELTGAGNRHKDSHGVLDGMGCDAFEEDIDAHLPTDAEMDALNDQFHARRKKRLQRESASV